MLFFLSAKQKFKAGLTLGLNPQGRVWKTGERWVFPATYRKSPPLDNNNSHRQNTEVLTEVRSAGAE